MAYNRVNIGKISGKGRYFFSLKELSGGLSKFDNGNDASPVQMSNMLFENGVLSQRGGFCDVCGAQGSFHSILDRESYGGVYMHIGSALVCFDGNKLVTVKDGISDCKSVFLAMNGNIYLYTRDYKIYEIKKDMTCTQVQAYVPEIARSRNIGFTDYDVIEPVNLLTRRVKCTYYTKLSDCILTLPFDMDADEPAVVYADGKLEKELFLSRNGVRKAMLSERNTTNFESVTVEYAVGGEDTVAFDNLDKIFGCEISVCYGGTANDGTRAFFTGNDNSPGHYFRSELKNPLYFPDTNEEILGDCCEKITAVQKRYEKLFFFTEKHIYSMQYQFSTENGAGFPVTEIYSPVGCDMKNTVRSIDNTPVFADRNTGLYLLQSTDIFDELNVKHISSNLKGEWNVENATEKSFASCDFDRKYYIYDGQALFVWDYGATPYYNGGDQYKAESRLSWYRLDGLSSCVYIFSFEGKLYFVTGDLSARIIGYFPDEICDTFVSDGKEEKCDISSSFTTKPVDLNTESAKKRLLHFSFDCSVYEKNGDFTVEFYGDGKKFYSICPKVPEDDRRIKIKLPPFYADKFAVKFIFRNAKLGVSGLNFCYVPIQREKYNF